MASKARAAQRKGRKEIGAELRSVREWACLVCYESRQTAARNQRLYKDGTVLKSRLKRRPHFLIVNMAEYKQADRR
jgi:hypothetical protein